MVDHRAAERLLREAILIAQGDSSQLPATEWNTEIRTIIQGKHLTFRYILNVVFIELISFDRAIIALCPGLSFATFLEKLQYYAINTRVKDEVFVHIKRVFQSLQFPQQ
jgi:hypothetical protein